MEQDENFMDEDDTWFEIIKKLMMETEIDMDVFKQVIDFKGQMLVKQRIL